jgi:hypothetical protein
MQMVPMIEKRRRLTAHVVIDVRQCQWQWQYKNEKKMSTILFFFS